MSRPPRFFISPDQVRDRRITLSGEDVRHIGAVLRMKPGDLLSLADGTGTEYTARVIEAGHAEIWTEVVSQSKQEISGPRVILGQGLPKSDKMDWIAQKATELGVSAMVPLVTERTIVKIKDEEKRISRWQKICREAAMQSNRLDIPKVEPLCTFSDYLRNLAPGPGTLLLFPWEEGTLPVRTVLKQHQEAKQIIVLIGPEGGFSQAEAEQARGKGFQPVSLGRNILRTETAALSTLSMIVYEYS